MHELKNLRTLSVNSLLTNFHVPCLQRRDFSDSESEKCNPYNHQRPRDLIGRPGNIPVDSPKEPLRYS